MGVGSKPPFFVWEEEKGSKFEVSIFQPGVRLDSDGISRK